MQTLYEAHDNFRKEAIRSSMGPVEMFALVSVLFASFRR